MASESHLSRMAPPAAPSDRAGALAGRRLVFVLPSLELGGAERQAIHLARYLAAQERCDVHVWGLADQGKAAELCKESGLPWRLMDSLWGAHRATKWAQAAMNLACELRRARADAVLAYCATPNILCGFSWKLAGAKLFIWNQRDAGLHLQLRHRDRLAVSQTPIFIANSPTGAEFLTGSYHLETDRVQVIPNGISMPSAKLDRTSWRAKLDIADASFVACMVANLHGQKDHPALLRAWRIAATQLQVKGRDAVLVLAGRHDEAAPIRALISELDLEKNVRLPGAVDDVTGLLEASDIGVFSSQHEGLPNGLLEAMACGLAIVATDIPPIRYCVGEQGQPWLAPPTDAGAMAEKILALARDPGAARELGLRNRHRVESRFSLAQMCRRYMEILNRELVSSGAQAPSRAAA